MLADGQLAVVGAAGQLGALFLGATQHLDVLVAGGHQRGAGLGQLALELVDPLLGGAGRRGGLHQLGLGVAAAVVILRELGLDLGDATLGGERALERRGHALVGGQRALIGVGGAALGVGGLGARVGQLRVQLGEPGLGGGELVAGLRQPIGPTRTAGGVELGLEGGDPALGDGLLLGHHHAGLGLGHQELVVEPGQLLAVLGQLGLVARLLFGERAIAGAGRLGDELVALERRGLGLLVAFGGGVGDQPLALGRGLGEEPHPLGLGLGGEPRPLGVDRHRDRLGAHAGDRGDLLAGRVLGGAAHRLERVGQAGPLGDRGLELLAHAIALGGGLAEALLGLLARARQLAELALQLLELGLGRRQLLARDLVLGVGPGRRARHHQLVLERADLLLDALGPVHGLVALQQHRGQLVGGGARLGVHLADQLADALGQRGALVLDRRAGLALHREPVRELGVDPAGRRQRALGAEHLDEQAAHQRDLPGR